MVDISNIFRTKLVSLREDEGLSQDELAEKCHVSRLTISRWERGETWPKPDDLSALAKAFRVDPKVFFMSEEPSKSDKVQSILYIISHLEFLDDEDLELIKGNIETLVKANIQKMDKKSKRVGG